MPRYMLQFTYQSETWAALSKNPVDRTDVVRALAKKLGGKMVSLDYTMGEYDGVCVLEAPDDTSAMAMVIAAVAPGHLKSTKTTRLYTPAEMLDVLKKAHGAGYQAPKG